MSDRLQPRNGREQRLVDETLRDAEQIRTARRACNARAMQISPRYTPEQKEEARARVETGQRLRELMRTRHSDDIEDVQLGLTALVAVILDTGTPAAEWLAGGVYELALTAWELNRRDPDPGEWDERNTARHFKDLAEAAGRAERNTEPAVA